MIEYRAKLPDSRGDVRVREFDTVEQAFLHACDDLRTGAARPVGIYGEDGVLLHDARKIESQCIELAEQQ